MGDPVRYEIQKVAVVGLPAESGASGVPAVTGAFAGTGQSASFGPLVGRPFNISLWGTFAATVRLERSFDAGVTWLPLTAQGIALCVWTGPVSESWEEGEANVLYRLSCTAFSSGPVNYRVSQ